MRAFPFWHAMIRGEFPNWSRPSAGHPPFRSSVTCLYFPWRANENKFRKSFVEKDRLSSTLSLPSRAGCKAM